MAERPDEVPGEMADRLDGALARLWQGDASAFGAELNAIERGAGDAARAALFAGAAAGAGADALPPGTAVGKYRIVRLLGRGGMGVVYEAEQSAPARRVALKVLPDAARADAYRIKAFEREIDALARVHHPNIASVFEAGADGQRRYFAMELLPGPRLDQHARRPELSLRARVEIFAKVAAAVGHAHQRGIIHRDLKPQNVLLDAHGAPKVLDFGLARALDAEVTRTTLRVEEQSPAGTLAYMSPEQARCDFDAIGPASDVYALGVMLFETVTGARPYELAGLSAAEAAHAIATCPPAPMRDRAPGAPRDLELIAGKALEKDPAQRYATAAELAADVAAWLDGRPVAARAPSLGYLLRVAVRRHAGIVATLLLAGLSSLAIFGWAFQSVRAERERALPSALLMGQLEDLELDAERLWPCSSELIPAMEQWIARAHELGRGRGAIERQRDSLAAGRGEGSDSERWRLSLATKALIRLDALEQSLLSGHALPGLPRRLEFARTVRQRSIDEHRLEWQIARAMIGDEETCPAYAGLTLEPQLGLVPVGQDPRSGLYEFVHILSGEIPARDPRTKRLLLTEQTGIVLVLIPGGTGHVGAQGHSQSQHNRDPDTQPAENGVWEVTLSPFFLSKYEMTYGQWKRCTGLLRIAVQDDLGSLRGLEATLLHPLDMVSHTSAALWMPRLGLALPTEIQWEYACRAGTETPWFCGADPSALNQYGNVGDKRTALLLSDSTRSFATDLDDGFPHDAPVGSFLPNAFGLHDTIGNVAEWCLERFAPYSHEPADDGSGRRPIAPYEGEQFVARGGHFQELPLRARSAARSLHTPLEEAVGIGIRPARPLDTRID